jgi:hypothetical protein
MKTLRILIPSLFLFSCANNTGETSIFAVDQKKQLTSPLVAASALHSNQSIIYKTNETTAAEGNDTFAIYLTDSYLRYLPDVGGVNEVIIVVEFVEVVNGDESDKVTKILGPYESVADATRAPIFHKALYGPKRMESDLLSITIKIYEYDLEENSKVGSLIDFIGNAGETLSVSNPITAQEIKVASELAKTVANTNENDLILQMDMDFVAGNSLYQHPGNTHVNVLPLKAGELVLIKKEACGFAKCFDYYSQGNVYDNPVGLLADIILSPITAISRGLTDSPAGSSLSEIEKNTFKMDDSGLTQYSEWHDKYTFFRDKTWLRLSIVKGGDPALWDKRKALYPVEAQINKLLKNPSGFNSTALTQAISSLQTAQKKAAAAQTTTVRLVSGQVLGNTQYIQKNSTDATLCLALPVGARVQNALQFTIGNVSAITPAPTVHKCFQLKPSIAGGTFNNLSAGHFQVSYILDNNLLSHISRVKVINPFTANVTLACKLKSDEIQLTINLNQTEGLLSIDTNGSETIPSMTDKVLTHNIANSSDNVALKTVFGKTPVNIAPAIASMSNCN